MTETKMYPVALMISKDRSFRDQSATIFVRSRKRRKGNLNSSIEYNQVAEEIS